jgi:hypothetical protein
VGRWLSKHIFMLGRRTQQFKESRHTLAGGLEVQPLFLVIFLGEGVQRQLVFLIVGIDQILNDCAGFPEGDIGIWIDYGGYTAIGVQFLVWRFLEVGHVHENLFVWQVELLEDDGDLPGIGAARMTVESNGLDGRHFEACPRGIAIVPQGLRDIRRTRWAWEGISLQFEGELRAKIGMKDRRKGMDTLRVRSPYIQKKCTPHIVALWAPLTAMHDPKFDMVTVLGILPVVQRREPSLVRKVTRNLIGRETRKKLPHWHAALGHWRTKCSYPHLPHRESCSRSRVCNGRG